MANATCINGHESDLGDVPTDEGVIKWECPECQEVGDVPGTEPLPPQEPDAPADNTVTSGDTATSTSTQ